MHVRTILDASMRVHVYPSVCLSLSVSVCLSVCLSVSVSVCLSLSLFVSLVVFHKYSFTTSTLCTFDETLLVRSLYQLPLTQPPRAEQDGS